MKRLAQTAVLGAAVAIFFLASRPAAQTVAAQTQDAPPDAAALFAKNCATCHGKDGRAKTFKAKFNHARNLTDSGWQAQASDERIFNSISAGRGKMPAFGQKLSRAQIESLVAHVRGLKKT
jgi:cytochrome c6